MTYKCIQHRVKENLLLLKDLLELKKAYDGCLKKCYFEILDNIVDNHNNKHHRNITMKPTDVKPDSFAEYNIDYNEKDPKFQVGYHVRISKYHNIFDKGYIQIGHKFL